MHDVRMGGTDDARSGATTKVVHNVWMGHTYDARTNGMYDARTGATTDISYDVLTVGDYFTGFSCR